MKKILLIGLASLAIAGCSSTPASLNFTPSDLNPVSAKQKIDAEIKTINISIATKEEQKGELQVGVFGNTYEQSFKTTFQNSLEESLAKTAIFKDDAKTKLTLLAKVLRFQSPGSGINFDTHMTVKYDFIDRSSGESIYNIEINSFGAVPFDYDFMGAIRATEARNRAVKNNIHQLIERLKNDRFVRK